MAVALIFDMDGTLVDSERQHWEAWREVLISRGVEAFPFSDFVRYVGTSNEKLAEDFIVSDGLDATVGQLVQEKQLIYLDMIPHIRLLPGVRQVLETFGGAYRLAIASSSPRLELDKIVAAHGLQDCFEVIVGGDMVARKKPDPEIYLTACRLLDLTARDCVAFEDSESGLQAAKAAGLFTVTIPNSLSGLHDFRQADLLVNRIDQVDENRFPGT